jgi:hypothetical protein
MANSSNRTIVTYENGGPHPRNFNFSPTCPTNEQASLLPARSQYGAVEWQTVPMSPGNVRHQYSEKPFDYEDMYMSVPKGTLYDHDFSMNGPTGQGQKKVMVGHFKAWPLTNRHVFEAKDYNSGYFKKPGFISSNEYDYGVVSQPNHLRTHWTGTGV